ncbi:KinB-signaling pathway activation protein [Bacillus cihuensis]|uniref:KinB-signaling pathway activation protein n=1 Tax=Bacillus cihuensis TaxID=1208599 RepID=UPI00041885AC|nr:KinB-signaling pathway activation protein [Bacillus cihuensis]
MNSRNIVRLFISTLLVGGITGGIVGFVVRWEEFTSFDLVELLSVFVWLVGVGLIFSVISQAGFFAYLTIHRFGLGIFKSTSLWNGIQIVLIAFVLGDLVYFRYINFADKGEGVLPFVYPAVFLLIFGAIIAYIKVKQTNKQAFIPALFFMTVITVLEWVPVLRTDDDSWLYFMLYPLLACNVYQLLILNRLIDASQKELATKRAKQATITNKMMTQKKKDQINIKEV